MMKRMVRTSILLLPLTLATGGVMYYLFSSSPASADRTITGPHQCLPKDGGAASYYGRQVIEDGERHFVCPLTRHYVTGELDHVRVGLFNHHPTAAEGNPRCCVRSYPPYGPASEILCDEASNDLVNQSIEFSLAGFDEFDYGHYVVTCRLGPDDGIRAIYYEEY